jgi:hypothetical protein
VHVKILLGKFNAKVGRDHFQTHIWKRIYTPKNLVVKSTMFLRRKLHKYTWTIPEEKTHHQIDQILKDRKWHWSILNVRFFRGANCDTEQMRRLGVCTNHEILFERPSREEKDGRGLYHVWWRGYVYTGFWWGSLRERDHLEN